MLSKIFSSALLGIDGLIIQVETDISNGLPGFAIVGLPDAAVKESKERVKTAIKNSVFEYPIKRITVNLAPADIKKEGPCFDLPIAIGILYATGQIICDCIDEILIIGELSLDGNVKAVNGVLCMICEAYKKGFKKIIVPFKNAKEAGIIKEIDIYPVSTLKEAVNILENIKDIKGFKIENNDLIENEEYDDFLDIKGQEGAKRAFEIAAAGGHNIIMIGPPGSGKTMLAKRLPGILPDITLDEAIEITKIYSISGNLNKKGFVNTRPFRSPHHTISAASLVGGGKIPKPGEVSLSHFGVLFLDELPEFQRNVLEVLRQPIEDGKVNISRVNSNITYPSIFMLVASMNPCPCGYFLDPIRECTCTSLEIRKYLSKISGPLLDRFDIHIEISPVKFDELQSERYTESSKSIKERVNKARKIQVERYKNSNIYCNSQLTSSLLKKYCKINSESLNILKKAFESLGLSARAYNKILKISRTIADMDEREHINKNDICEAIQYRSMDRKYWDR